ncbi:uncharacterized protein B0H18DRAFT_1009930 [Fomitopsis serialis]|uniref:uncharacterized protein n=1 Tax=Fomitopsis serialis TaxID=139415 RepID=UPI0020078AE6|nr:uncharacterized protein B0H18DRAFT_1009930 [Neoantrodia serialis]KAH9925120.1 hypothetical protein B0H18DRAFT_1009930 [Neoantrodia serialis]
MFQHTPPSEASECSRALPAVRHPALPQAQILVHLAVIQLRHHFQHSDIQPSIHAHASSDGRPLGAKVRRTRTAARSSSKSDNSSTSPATAAVRSTVSSTDGSAVPSAGGSVPSAGGSTVQQFGGSTMVPSAAGKTTVRRCSGGQLRPCPGRFGSTGRSYDVRRRWRACGVQTFNGG